jgi:hypothetical protein
MGLPVEWIEKFAAAGMTPVGDRQIAREGLPVARGGVISPRAAESTYRELRQPLKPTGPSEEDFLNEVMDYARSNEWACAHFRAARTEHGWRTAVSGDGKGFVDLVMVRERVVWAELKTAKGRLSPEQRAWSDRLKAARCEVYLWRPASWGEIRRVLGP